MGLRKRGQRASSTEEVEKSTVEKPNTPGSAEASTVNSSASSDKEVQESAVKEPNGGGSLDASAFNPSNEEVEQSTQDPQSQTTDDVRPAGETHEPKWEGSARPRGSESKGARLPGAGEGRPGHPQPSAAGSAACHALAHPGGAAQRHRHARRNPDILTLSGRLLLVLTHSCVLARAVLLNAVIKRRLKALLVERYGEKLDLTHLWTEIRL
jgi:hypothetical protein